MGAGGGEKSLANAQLLFQKFAASPGVFAVRGDLTAFNGFPNVFEFFSLEAGAVKRDRVHGRLTEPAVVPKQYGVRPESEALENAQGRNIPALGGNGGAMCALLFAPRFDRC